VFNPSARVTAGAYPAGGSLPFSRTCLEAPEIEPGRIYIFFNPDYGSLSTAWAKMPITALPELIYGKFVLWGVGHTMTAYYGTGCGDLTEIFDYGSLGCMDGYATSGTWVYFKLQGDFILPGTSNVQFGYGTCPA